MGFFNFKREIKWDKDVMKVTDSVSSILDGLVNEMSDKMKNEQTSEVLRHFDIDMSELREFLCDKEEWRRKQEASIPKWIPVTDRLPEKHEWVLVCSEFVKMRTDFIKNNGHWYTTPAVTHWMPLPEPPKEVDNV